MASAVRASYCVSYIGYRCMYIFGMVYCVPTAWGNVCNDCVIIFLYRVFTSVSRCHWLLLH